MSEVISLSVMAFCGLRRFARARGRFGVVWDWFIGYLVVFSQIIPPARSLADGYFRVSKGVASWTELNELFEVSWSGKRIWAMRGPKPPHVSGPGLRGCGVPLS